MSDFVFLHFTSSPCQREYDIVGNLYEKSEFAEYFYGETSFLVHYINDLTSIGGLRTLEELICHELDKLGEGENLIPCISIGVGGPLLFEVEAPELFRLGQVLINRIAEFFLLRWHGSIKITSRIAMFETGRYILILTPIFLSEEKARRRRASDYYAPFSSN